ncbi:MAG: hypothetical protein AAGH78_14460 [Cyanobacteria bacterium P01_H01_bin.58]
MVARLRHAIALLLVILVVGLAGCGGNREEPAVLLDLDTSRTEDNALVGELSEVSPPERIQQLKPFLDVYTPQVRIISPRNNDVIASTEVAVQVQVRDLPIYKDADLELGPHLQVFLDDQPSQTLYHTETPIVFADLAPGTHTVRVFAVRPWEESFKNDGAYDQVTFNVFTNSQQNNPDSSRPLLTYSQPQGAYGTEPIMLDFYLTNAPLHVVAENDEAIADWRIRCTVNGQSFVFDRWQPIYLKGFKPGKNWVKLEAIDENGSAIENAFNTAIRLVDYTPGAQDPLSQIIRGDIPLARAKGLVDPNYEPPVPPSEDTMPEEPESEADTPTESASQPAAEDITDDLEPSSSAMEREDEDEESVQEETEGAGSDVEALSDVDSMDESTTQHFDAETSEMPPTEEEDTSSTAAESDETTSEPTLETSLPETLGLSDPAAVDEAASAGIQDNSDEQPTSMNIDIDDRDETVANSEEAIAAPADPDEPMTPDEAATDDATLSTPSESAADIDTLDRENPEPVPAPQSPDASRPLEDSVSII